MRRPLFATIFGCFLFLEILLASQVHSPLSPEVLEKNTIFNLYDQHNVRIHLNVNVRSCSLEVTDTLLVVSAERGIDDSAWCIFDVYVDLDVPLNNRLNLNYSLYASQLNLSTDATRIYLTLVNGTHTILLFYVVGFKTADLIPDPAAEKYSYIFYQVGDGANTWFNGKRNLWADLASKALSLNSSWRIANIVFGVKSYVKETEISNHRIEGFFDLAGNSLYYENLVFARLSPRGGEVSWGALAGAIVIFFLFVGLSYSVKASEAKTRKHDVAKESVSRGLVRLESSWGRSYEKC